MLDVIEWTISFVGARRAGIVPVPVNTLLAAEDYSYLIGHSAIYEGVETHSGALAFLAVLVRIDR
jgi:acyl-CoA synthetase (AMP-forming)/AMP-acid ligase II